ncbi:hypothetical protein ILUMI_03509 [Ignelater luminosus]|uniref:Lipase domain-containing protein n=1 Tax=Ignelater luminosus TaxID=2038154 RepID=A0A8K0DLN4_IGNLU|nr:hypothetical protein ILUMI_03509 [Ignelater luminosus]
MKIFILFFVLIKSGIINSNTAFRDVFIARKGNMFSVNMLVAETILRMQEETKIERLSSYIRKEIMTSPHKSMPVEDESGNIQHLSLITVPKNLTDIHEKLTAQLSNITFHIYTRRNSHKPQTLRLHNWTSLTKTNFEKSRPVKIIVHEWQSSAMSKMCLRIKDAYLVKYNYNIVMVDWRDLAKNTFYTYVVMYTKYIANIISDFTIMLVDYGVNVKNVHLIGYGIGAHIAGFSQEKARNVGRITGLDPIRQGFMRGVVSYFGGQGRLSTNNARFVDVIHTCAGSFGIEFAIGHADFYPNGGQRQPGCGSISNHHLCSHRKALEIFIESIYNKLVAFQCDYRIYKHEEVVMGDKTPLTTRGIFCTKSTKTVSISLNPKQSNKSDIHSKLVRSRSYKIYPNPNKLLISVAVHYQMIKVVFISAYCF